MIVVDSSVWIGHFRNLEGPAVAMLRQLHPADILIGDVILLELLQGARDERHAAQIEDRLRQFPVALMLGPVLARKAAENYRLLRAQGITIRKTSDLVIGTFCISSGHRLLHADRDFDPMVTYLGLRIA